MDELVERVREALAAEYSGAGDGRIRDVPDRRAIRWYTTIGLVDRPLGMRGRTALYGPRHLQQLVAIKRQQAVGRSLSQIQGELNWVSPEALAELSRVPERLLEADGPAPDGAADDRHMRFWARQPAAAALPAALPAESPAELPAGRPSPARPVNGVALRGGVIVLVPHSISERDRDDIAAAAAPLLDLLDARGLLDGSSL
jgi:DNA-binding transcriptional MerR regulator